MLRDVVVLNGDPLGGPLVKARQRIYDETAKGTEYYGKNTMSKPRVILCERSGAWARAVARHLPPGVCLRETRGLGECAAELAETPTSLLALELTRQNFSGVLPLVSRIGGKFPRARVVILAQRGLDDYQWALREAGAVHFTSSPRRLQGLAELIRRHFTGIPVPPIASLAVQAWDELPWSDVAMA